MINLKKVSQAWRLPRLPFCPGQATRTGVWLGGLALALALPARATDYYASPTGTSSGNGSLTSPWDLQTALNQPSSVHPGDTIWLRGGNYRFNGVSWKFNSVLSGTASAPITVRQYPGERATVDGNIQQLSGGYTIYWGFEIMDSQTYGAGNTTPNRVTTQSGPWPTTWWETFNGKTYDYCVSGFDLRAPNCKLINIILHDNIGGGLGADIPAGNAEIYGLLSYYNGWQSTVDRGHGHGIYGQNALPSVKYITDSIIFDNFALGMQATGSAAPVADAFDIEGTAFFKNGELAFQPQQQLLIGPFQGASQNPVVKNCYIYCPSNLMAQSSFDMGYDGGTVNAIVESNYFQTSTWWGNNQGMICQGNTFLAGEVNNFNPANYPNNNYMTKLPTQNAVFIRPNKYEPGRGNIIIYNWQKLNNVSVDVSSFLPVGTPYKVVNAMNFFGTPVLTGTYQGGALSLPMTNLVAATPVGMTAPPPSDTAFNVFVVLPLTSGSNSGGSGPTNTAPTISAIGNQTISANQSSAALSFTISDTQTSAGSLTVSAKSSNTGLVPVSNIVLGGSGSSRTVTVTPAANQSGTATITLTVSDGALTSSTSFTVTVTPVIVTPVISALGAQSTYENIATTIPFTVSGVTSVTLSASSSNPTVVNAANITFGGSGANRTITITPSANQTGSANITITANSGTATGSQTFALSVIVPPVPTTKVYQYYSATNAALVAPMALTANATDSYVSTPTANASTPVAATSGSATFTVNVPVSGVYAVWGRVLSPSASGDSFFVSADGGPTDVYDDAEGIWSNAWQWTVVNGRGGTGTPGLLSPRTFLLNQGANTITFIGREANATLGAILVTDDLTFVPQDLAAVNESLTAAANQTTEFPASAFLANANNAAGGTLLLSVPEVYSTQHGTVTYCGSNVSYTPAAGFTGTDTFNFTVTIPGGASSSAIATVTVK